MGRGRGGKSRGQRPENGPGRRQATWDDKRSSKQDIFYDRSQMTNADFEEYYTKQAVVPEGEWEAFLDALRKPLPITFRINGSGKFANEVRDKLQSDFFSNFSKGAVLVDDEPLQPPRPLPWYPNNLAWHMNFSRGQLRKLPWLSSIHEFMKTANDSGVLTRQEAVSMVPPMFMDVQPHHMVLDMCAAPGSKTFQLLEALHSSDTDPSGLVMANDADPKRCNLLIHQTKRMCSPCLMIANHAGEQFPRINKPAGQQQQQRQQEKEEDGKQQEEGEGTLLYDRILCDVPCSGDGTMRKAPDIWRRWNCSDGNGLHSLQLRIALQGVRLLKVGGLMVYSTCTFNPVEDEAVVAELLLRAQGALELVDVSHQLPELKRLPGVTTWHVKDKFQWYKDWDEAQKVGFKLDPTMFPSPEKSALPLQRCMRILPHHQDTGGFFVAVLRKVAPTGTLQDPQQSHRLAKLGHEGADPLAAAQAASAYAVEAAERAVAALEAGDAAGARAAEQGTRAAMAKLQMAQESWRDLQNQQQQKEQQAAKRQRLLEQGAAQAGPASTGAEPAGSNAGGGADADVADADGAAATAVDDEQQQGVEEEAAGEAGEDGGEEGDEGEQEDAGPGPASTSAAEGSDGTKAASAPQPSWVRGGGGRGREGGKFRRGVDPIYPVEDPAILQSIVNFYGLDPAFPISTHLITRSLEGPLPKRMYYVGDAILQLLLADEKEVLKIVMTGLKLFERHQQKEQSEDVCKYRIAQEGLPFLLPHMTKQLLRLKAPDLIRLLHERSMPVGKAEQQDAAAASAANGSAQGAAAATTANGSNQVRPDAAAAGTAHGQQQQPAGQASKQPSQQVAHVRAVLQGANQLPLDAPYAMEQLATFRWGGGVCLLDDQDAAAMGFATGTETAGALTASAPIAVAVWRTRASISVLVNKNECAQLLEKLQDAHKKASKAPAVKAGGTAGAVPVTAEAGNGAVPMDIA